MKAHQVDVLVVGGGPAGMVLACLTARQGLNTLVVERNPDFDREFRGEILQPRFHRAMADVGLLEHIKTFPHESVEEAQLIYEGKRVGGVKLESLDPGRDSTWWMTQPTLLGALESYARHYECFDLWFDSKITQLEPGGAVVERRGEPLEISAKVVVGSDGRFSQVRRLGHFDMAYDHHDFDVLWFTTDRPKDFGHAFNFLLTRRRSSLMLPKHPGLIQCGLVVPPDGLPVLRQRGLDAIKVEIAAMHPLLKPYAESLTDFSGFFPLKGKRDLVKHWAQDGVLLIGDAAHTCSPVGGIGVAIAAETACVAAAVINDCFEKRDFSAKALGRVQALREKAVRRVHAIQGRVGMPVNMPVALRRLIPYAAKFALSLGLPPLLARQLLSRRGPLPGLAAP